MQFSLTTPSIFIFFLFPFLSYSQNQDLEKDKLAVDTLFFLDQEKALIISEKNIPEAIAINDTNYITYFLDQAGELNRKAGNYDKAISQLNQCLSFKTNWIDLKDLSLTHNNLGKTYVNKGEYEMAAFHFIKALQLMEKADNKMGQGFYLNNLAIVYDLQHNYPIALEYYQRSLEVKLEINDSTGIAASYTNIGITYSNLGDFNKSLKFHEKAYEIYEELGSTTKIARTLNNMGEAYLQLDRNIQAKKYLHKAYQYDEENEDMHLRITINNNLGKSYFFEKKMDSAEYFLEKAHEMALKTKSFDNLRDVYALKAEISRYNENWEAATQNLSMQIAYQDSLVDEANIYAVAEMRGKYEYEKNLRKISEAELEIAQSQTIIQKQKSDLIFWTSIAIVSILVILVFFLVYFQKQKNLGLIQGQLALISSRKENLEKMNLAIQRQLDGLKVSLDEKEEILNEIFSNSTDKELPEDLKKLSPREMEVLSHLALGWSDEQLAEKLFISKATVKTHLRRIYSKLSVRGRAQAVSIANKYNLIGNVTDLNR